MSESSEIIAPFFIVADIMDANTTLEELQELTTLVTTKPPRTIARAATSIIHNGRICVWAIGTIGNILAFLIFSRKSMSGSVSVFLFRFLAIFDFLVVQDHIQGWMRYIGIDLFDQFDWTCKIAFWVFHSSAMISAWILVAVCIERFIGVVFPLKAKTLITMKRGRIFMFFLIVIGFFLNSLHTINLVNKPLYDRTLKRMTLICSYKPYPALVYYARKVSPWLIFSYYNGATVLIFILNVGIIFVLIHRKNLREVNVVVTLTLHYIM